MAFKHRNQMMLEQHTRDVQLYNDMRNVLGELFSESGMDTEQIKETFYALFEEHGVSLLDDVWYDTVDC